MELGMVNKEGRTSLPDHSPPLLKGIKHIFVNLLTS